MREYAFEIAVSLMFSVLILFVSIYAIGSKVVAWKSGEISLFIVHALEEYREIHDVLPATTQPKPVGEILYVSNIEFKNLSTNVPIFSNLNSKVEDISQWYYHCPASRQGQVSTLTLIAPVLNERDIELAARVIKKFTRWQYEVREIESKKYLFFYTKAICRDLKESFPST